MRTLNSNSGTVTVSSSLTTIKSEQPECLADTVAYELNNTGSAALTDFQLQFQARSGGAWYTALAAADWAAIIAGSKAMPAFLLGVFTNPATLAASGAAMIIIQPTGLYAYRFQGVCGSSTTVTLIGNGRTLR
jgi:hypothetical protein